MEHSITEVLKQLLVDTSAVGALMTDPWPCYQGVHPDKPDNSIAIYETAGLKEGRIMSSGEVIEWQGFQIAVRGRTYTEAFDQMDLIIEQLDAARRTEVTVKEEWLYTVHTINRDGPPLHVPETSGKRRTFFSVNGLVKTTDRLLAGMMFQPGSFVLFQDGDIAVPQSATV